MKTYKTPAVKRERAKRYYAAHREERLIYAKQHREEHGEAIRAYHRSDAARLRKNALQLARNRANPERIRALNAAHHLKRYHRLTVADHVAMHEAQQGVCAICQKPPVGKAHCGKLHVDHNHETGQIRDLLCANCNRGLGLFADDPLLLTKAAWYVERHRAAARHTA